MKSNTVRPIRAIYRIHQNYNGLLIWGIVLLFIPFILEFLVYYNVLTGGPTKERTPIYSIMVFIALMSIVLWVINQVQKNRT